MDTQEINVGDGFIHLRETVECRVEVTFENYLGPSFLNYIEQENVRIMLQRGNGELPDHVYVFDDLTGENYHMIVNDKTSETTCVPWPLIG